MAGIRATDGEGEATVLEVREPRQRRTREQWERVLDAGVRLLEEEGYEGFTIAALCERAGVAPRALYARADSKDALFLAVYEHGMRRVTADEAVFEEDGPWHGADDRRRVELAVRHLVRIFVDHTDFLRAVVLISGAHPEVRRRGELYREAVAARFVAALTPLGRSGASPGPPAGAESCFSLVFSALVVRTAYGEGFGFAGDPEVLAGDLATMAQRYLLTDEGSVRR